MKKTKLLPVLGILGSILLLGGCGQNDRSVVQTSDSVQEQTSEPDPATENEEVTENIMDFSSMELARSYKGFIYNNPVMTQRFGADPYVMVYEDRAYLYMTADTLMTAEDGSVVTNNYSNINTINVLSSSDLVNWTDHGSVYAASRTGAATWGNNSWAPAAAYKEIDGKMKFYLYFANSGNGIAVLSSDSPTGPFVDELGEALVSRNTPTCAEVTWLFDPAVLMDDDGSAYLYFGGGIPSPDKADNPGTARVVKLGADMMSLDGDPVPIENVRYLFEDSGINKINGTYYYSYCSNFNVTPEAKKEFGFDSGEIVTMRSDSPMGPFTLCGSILKNPQAFFGRGGNNHHCMFEFKGGLYMAYHTRILEEAMGIDGGYRSTNIDAVKLDENGNIRPITGTKEGVAPVGTFHPYERVNAATMWNSAGITTTQFGEESIACGSGDMIVTGIGDGSWIGLKNVDFGESGPKKIGVAVRGTGKGTICVDVDMMKKETLVQIPVEVSDAENLVEIEVPVEHAVSGVHTLYFIFAGEDYEIESWWFEQ